METNTPVKILQRRTSGGCIAGGFHLYSTIFRRLLRASWPVAVVYGLSVAALLAYIVRSVLPLMELRTIVDPEAAASLWTMPAIITGVLVLVFVAVATVLSSYAVSAARSCLSTGDYPRPVHWWGRLDLSALRLMAMVAVWLIVLTAVYVGVVALMVQMARSMALTSLWVGAAVLALVLLALILPLSYTVWQQFMAPKFSAMPPVRGYLSGLGHWGLLFVVALITAIAALLLTLVTQLPALILLAANVQSAMGVVGGDDVGMPSSLWWLSLVVLFIGGFVQAYVHLSTFFLFLFAWGSIRSEEELRSQANV